ncbi:MAG: hypothetical protein ACOY93_22330 [Bacillota bacterium]
MEQNLQSVAVSWVFSVLYMLFCIYRPRPARIFVGLFYIVMGLGVNMTLVFLYPEGFAIIGQGALLPFYRALFEHLVSAAPAAWGLFIAIFEITMGIMILQKGLTARLGLIGYTVFCLAITPLNWMAFPAWCLAIGHIHILRSGVVPDTQPHRLRPVN